MAEWYEKPYPQNPSPPKVELPRNLKVGVTDGPDVIAMKRGVSRGGRWPWPKQGAEGFDDTYSKSFANGKDGGNVGDSGVKGVQRQSSIAADGEIGPATFEKLRCALVPDGLPNEGKPLFDSVCLDLLEEASTSGHPGGGESALIDYAKRSISNEPKIHYSQARAMTHLGDPPENGFTADCSGHSTSCFYEAGWPDPNHSGYNGYGYTGTLQSNPKVGSPYQVGDLALYGTSSSNTTHVVTCYAGGNSSTAKWVSHGSEAAPYAVYLHYRSDLLFVVRPPKK